MGASIREAALNGSTRIVEQFIQLLSGPAIIVDRKGKLLALNSDAMANLNLPKKSVIDQELWSIFDTDIEKVQRMLKNWSRSSQPVPGSLSVRKSENICQEFRATGRAIPPSEVVVDGGILIQLQLKAEGVASFVALNSKVRELQNEAISRRKAQEEVILLNRELELRVDERTAALKQAIDELQDRNDKLRDLQSKVVQSEKMASLGALVAGISHEINTPIGMSLTTASYFQDKVKHYKTRYKANELTRSDFESFLGTSDESSTIILSNLRRAAELIKSFKQVAVDQSHYEKRNFLLLPYIQQLLLSLKPQLRVSNHQVVTKCDERLSIDSFPGVISQVLTNFVMNSINHGFDTDEQAGLMEIIVVETEGDVELIYRDNGKGVDSEQLKQLFDPFYTTKRNEGGTGLGLHIVYNLVAQKLGGSLESKSKPGEGLEFKIRFTPG